MKSTCLEYPDRCRAELTVRGAKADQQLSRVPLRLRCRGNDRSRAHASLSGSSGFRSGPFV
jgi:hypothetical protein